MLPFYVALQELHLHNLFEGYVMQSPKNILFVLFNPSGGSLAIVSYS